MESEQNNNFYNIESAETTQFVLPEHLNHMGNMHGGEILKLMDNTAGLAFIRYVGGDAVTAGVKEVKFIHPIPHRSIIRCKAEVVATGRTSIQVKVAVFIELLDRRDLMKAAEGTFIGVAIDEEGKPKHIPSIIKKKSN